MIADDINHAIAKAYIKAKELEKILSNDRKGLITFEYRNHTTDTWYEIEDTLKTHLHKITSSVVLYGDCTYRIVK